MNYVKICGVRTVEDAREVVAAGASALGLVFAASPRRVGIDAARDIGDATRGELLRVAVFRDQSDEEILPVLERVDVDAVQVHGRLSDAVRESVRAQGRSLIKALSVSDEDFVTFDESLVDAVLVDGPSPGSGQTHSWAALAERPFTVPVIAAGGLRPDNVAAVIAATGASGVDCASGVESSPGQKDAALVGAFVARARDGFARQRGEGST